MEKLTDSTVTQRLETEKEQETQAPVNVESSNAEVEAQLEIQQVGMVWAIVMCLGAFQEVFMKSLEALEFYRNNPADLLGQSVHVARILGLLPMIYLLLRVLIDKKYLSGKPRFSQFWPCYLHILALSPFFIRKLTDFSLTRGEQFKILVNWIVELFSSFIILVVYRIEDASESPLIQMKPYAYIKPVIIKED